METKTTDGSRFGTELFAHLGTMLVDPSELRPFMHWFSKALWEAEGDTSEDILDFAYLVENLIGIHSAGLWTDKELMWALTKELRALTEKTAAPLSRFETSWMPHRRPIVLSQSATLRLRPGWAA